MFASCKVSDSDMLMEYKIQPGKSTKSYGIELLKSMNFPKRVVFNSQLFNEGFERLERKEGKMEEEREVNAYSVPYEKKLRILQEEENMRANNVPKEEIVKFIRRELGLCD